MKKFIRQWAQAYKQFQAQNQTSIALAAQGTSSYQTTSAIIFRLKLANEQLIKTTKQIETLIDYFGTACQNSRKN